MIDLDYPFRGPAQVRNSPADRMPSHGTDLLASARAVDFVPCDERGRTAPITLASLVRREPPEHFPGFGAPILAPCDGVVVGAIGDEPDHEARRGLPSVGYALTQGRRAAAGWRALAGNVILLAAESGVVVALCHLQRGSVAVRVGDRVGRGDPVARCGNSGNSTEPHVHVQAMDGPDAATARPVAMTFRGGMPTGGTVVRG